jgi:hypothetical protein
VDVAEPETFTDLDALVELHNSDNQVEALEEEVFLELCLFEVLILSNN